MWKNRRGWARGKFFQIHRVTPVLRFTKRKIPFLPPKCPIQAKVLNISLIFIENLWGMGGGKNFPKSIGSPLLCSLYGPKEESLWIWKIFPFIIPYLSPRRTFLRKMDLSR